MAVGFRGSHAWLSQNAVGSLARSVATAGGVSGDRAFLIVSWKDFSITGSVSPDSQVEVVEFADGSVAAGNGTGSMKIAVYYCDVSTGTEQPAVQFSGTTDVASATCLVFTKDASEVWDTPLAVTAAWPATSTTQTVSASSTVAVPSSGVVIGGIGLRDDSAAFTRATTTGIDVASGITWNGNYVEAPATHATTTLGGDMAADSGYRLVTTGGTVTLRQTATISATETGAVVWIAQGVSAAPDYTPMPYIGGGYYG